MTSDIVVLRRESITNTSVDQNDLLTAFIILPYTYICGSFHHSSKIFLATVSRNHYRKPQVDTIQRSMAYGNPSPKGYISPTTPIFTFQGTSAKEGKGRLKSHNIMDTVPCLPFLEVAA